MLALLGSRLLPWGMLAAVALGAWLWIDSAVAQRALAEAATAAARRELAIAAAVNERQRETIGRFDVAARQAAADAAAAADRARRLQGDLEAIMGELRHAEDGPAADVLLRAYRFVQQRSAAAGGAD